MTSQTDIIIQSIIGRIEQGGLAPGDTLEESTLAREFDVSRTPVREALLQLEATGLVRRKARGGATVFRPTIEEFLAILEVHAKLEGCAAGLAARRLGAGDATAIEHALADCVSHAETHGDGRPDRYYLCNLNFHKAVAEAAHNPVLLDLIKTNARKLLAYYRARYHYKGTIAQSVGEHRAIVEAIVDRNPERAEMLMAAHVQFDNVTAMDLVAAMPRSQVA